MSLNTVNTVRFKALVKTVNHSIACLPHTYISQAAIPELYRAKVSKVKNTEKVQYCLKQLHFDSISLTVWQKHIYFTFWLNLQ